MKMLSFAILAVAAVAVVPFESAEAGRRGGCGCCGSTTYAAPAAASPAAAANVAPATTVAQNQGQGYRSFSYQPGTAAPAINYNSGYNNGWGRTSAQSYWHNGGASKSLGRVNP